MNKKNYLSLAIIICTSLMSIPSFSEVNAPVEADKKTAVAPKSADKEVALAERKILAEKQQKIIHEARDAISEIQQALVALENKDTKIALSALKSASSNLEIVLAKNTGMSLIPVDIDVDIIDFEGDNDTADKMISEAKKLLDAGKVQGAREILAGLASEIRTTTVSIPLGAFPEAIKEAVKAIDDKKISDAKNILNEALNMLVEEVDVMPLPVLRAEALLNEAAELEHTQDLSKEKSREDVLKFTDAAKSKLKLAELLGYGNKDDYQLLYQAIDEMKTVVSSEKSSATWEKIKKTLADLKNKIIPAKK